MADDHLQRSLAVSQASFDTLTAIYQLQTPLIMRLAVHVSVAINLFYMAALLFVVQLTLMTHAGSNDSTSLRRPRET